MKAYQKKRDLREAPASNDLPILPAFETCDPAVGDAVYRWFDKSGNYLGWCSYEVGRKFLVGKLYYKTKGAFTIKTRRSYENRSVRKIYICPKGTNFLAAYVILRTIREKDLIELSDRESLATMTLEVIKKHHFTSYNFTTFPDEFKIVPNEIREKFAIDMQKFLADKKQELVDYLQFQIADSRKAKEVFAQGTESTNNEWVIEGLV